VRRVKADAYRHAHGQPLKPLTTANDQLCFEDCGLTYRERLMAVERGDPLATYGTSDGRAGGHR
jgi:hypothetical protein